MALFGLVSAVAGFVKVRFLIEKAIIDNLIFRCHYRITSAILFVFCILVTANNLIGKCFMFFFKYKLNTVYRTTLSSTIYFLHIKMLSIL